MLFSPSCKVFNSLKKDIQHFYIGPILCSKNKIMVSRKVDGQILFGARDEKRKNLFGAKWHLQIILFGSQRVTRVSDNKYSLDDSNLMAGAVCRNSLAITWSFDLEVENKGQGHGVQHSQWWQSMANIKIYKRRVLHLCTSLTVSEITFKIFEKVGQGYGVQLSKGVIQWQIKSSIIIITYIYDALLSTVMFSNTRMNY